MGIELNIDLPQKIGKGYKDFWNNRDRYLAVKGGRGSKKSVTAGLKIIHNMMKYFHMYGLKPNTLVIRLVHGTHKDSTFAQLVWAIHHLGVEKLWHIPKAELKLTYKPSGQTILFRGMDNPLKITSITTTEGNLCWVWWEEAYQIKTEDSFDKIDMAIRGKIDPRLFKQHILTFNPWSARSWLKGRFFDNPRKNSTAMTKNFDCNEFLGDDDLDLYKEMEIVAPKRYNIEGRGNWGISEGLIYEHYEVKAFDYLYMRNEKTIYGYKIYKERYGLDFGYVNPNGFIAMLVDEPNKTIYFYDEIYKNRISTYQLYQEIDKKGYASKTIAADNANAMTIRDLFDFGLLGIYGETKSGVNEGITKLQGYKFVVHPRCENFIIELDNYAWDVCKISGKPLDKPIKEFDHLMDAVRYGTYDIAGDGYSF